MTKSEKFKKWFENFWYYYKWRVIIIGMIVITLFIGAFDMIDGTPADVTFIMATEQYFSDAEVGAFEKSLAQFCKDYDKNGKSVVRLNDIIIKKGTTNLEQLNSLQSKFLAQLQLGKDVVYVFDDAIYNRYFKDHKVLDDLSKLDSSLPEGTNRIALKDTGFMENFDMEDYPEIKQRYGPTPEDFQKDYESLYIGVRLFEGTNIENDERAKITFDKAYEFLKALIETRK